MQRNLCDSASESARSAVIVMGNDGKPAAFLPGCQVLQMTQSVLRKVARDVSITLVAAAGTEHIVAFQFSLCICTDEAQTQLFTFSYRPAFCCASVGTRRGKLV